ncbi:MAG: hypothetical protein ACRDQU_22830 [Pseudonocardiaceae bacterium]
MADPPPYPDLGDDTGRGRHRGPTTSTPRVVAEGHTPSGGLDGRAPSEGGLG